MSDDDPFEPFRNLRDRLAETTEPLGLKVVGFSIMPGEDPLAPNGAHVLFEIDPDSLRTPEDLATRDAFDSIMIADREAEHRVNADRIRDDLRAKMARGADGFLDDNEDEEEDEFDPAEGCPNCGQALGSTDQYEYACQNCDWHRGVKVQASTLEEVVRGLGGCPRCHGVLNDNAACDACGWHYGLPVDGSQPIVIGDGPGDQFIAPDDDPDSFLKDFEN